MITVSEIAKKAGVSATTVSLCFQKDSRISEKTRKKVLDIASNHGYFPNKIAQMLRCGESNLIGIVVSESDTPFMQDIVTNAEKVLSENGYNVMIFSTYREIEREREVLTAAMEFKARGLIVTACERDDPELISISKSGLPLVCVDSQPKNVKSHLILEDMEGISKMGVNYLLGLGHRKILFLNAWKEHEHFTSFATFNRVCKETLAANNVELGGKYFKNAGLYVKDGFKAVTEALWDGLDFTAVFCISDNVAVGAIDALEEKGKKIPTDVSVLGIDDSEIAKLKRISLTTIGTSYGNTYMHIGEMAADLLIRSIDDETYPLKEIIMLPKLVERDSCCVVKEL